MSVVPDPVQAHTFQALVQASPLPTASVTSSHAQGCYAGVILGITLGTHEQFLVQETSKHVGHPISLPLWPNDIEVHSEI